MKFPILPIALGVLMLATGCDKKPAPGTPTPIPSSLPGTADIESPRSAPPPVDAKAYDEGFKAGDSAGFAAARAHTKPVLPADDQLEVLGLEAAGADPARGSKWQRGFISGYREGWDRAKGGKR